MKSIRFAKKLFWICIALSVVETIYFGYNKTLISDTEKLCDTIINWGFLIAFAFYITPICRMIEKKVSEHEEELEQSQTTVYEADTEMDFTYNTGIIDRSLNIPTRESKEEMGNTPPNDNRNLI